MMSAIIFPIADQGLYFTIKALTAARKSFLLRDACRSCVLFCAAKSTPRVGDIVYVLKPNNTASLGLVRELEHKEKGSKTPWLVLQKWHALDPRTGSLTPCKETGMK